MLLFLSKQFLASRRPTWILYCSVYLQQKRFEQSSGYDPHNRLTLKCFSRFLINFYEEMLTFPTSNKSFIFGFSNIFKLQLSRALSGTMVSLSGFLRNHEKGGKKHKTLLKLFKKLLKNFWLHGRKHMMFNPHILFTAYVRWHCG